MSSERARNPYARLIPSAMETAGRMTKLSAAVLVLVGSVGGLSCSASSSRSDGAPPEYESARPLATTAPEEEPAPPPPYGSAESLGANVDAYMAGFGSKWGEAYAPSGILVVAYDGSPVVVRAYGKVDREKGGAFTVDTPLRIGSLTKQFTAVAVMRLADAGKLATTDSIRKLIPELPESFAPVTLHHLLGQTSGIPSLTGDLELLKRKGEEIPQADILGWISKRPPEFIPGSRFSYSNTNYWLLSLVIERTTKQRLAPALQELLFAPAGMTKTGSAIAGEAPGYVRDGRGNMLRADVVADALPMGAGYLRSTAGDLLKWDRALQGDTLLTPASREAILKPGAKCPECGGADYGYGIIVDKVEGSDAYWHNGAIDGYNAFLARVPDKRLTIVLLANAMDFDTTRAGRAVLKMSLSGQPVAPVVEREIAALDEAFATSVAGEYILTKEAKAGLAEKIPAPVLDSIAGLDLKWDEGTLSFKPVGQGRFVLRKGADGSLFNIELGVEITLDFGDPKKPQKKAKGLVLKQGPLTANYVRGKLPAKPAPKSPKKP